jgi:amino acid adenylation domain-containing protein
VSIHEPVSTVALELSAARRAVLEARLRGLARAPEPAPAAAGAEAPLTFDQERLWFLDRVGQGGRAYNVYHGVRLEGELDAAALERALGEVVRRHGALRTTVREADGAPVQAVAPFAGFALPADDLSGLDPVEREAELRRRVAEVADPPFDLAAGPLFRARLVRLGARDHALLLCMHHLVSDGWSLGIISRELWALYGAFREGRPSPLPDLPPQYADWAVWQRARPPHDEERQLAYWRARLAGAPELLELPADHPRPPMPSFRGGRVPVEAGPEVAEGLRALARAEGATLYMAVLAAFTVLLGRYGAGDDVVVGTPIAGRARKEVEGVVGLFMNTLVLRTDLSGDPTFREVVGRVRETVLGGWEHQDVPFARVIGELRPGRSLAHSTLFQVLFQLDEHGGGEAAAPGGLRVRELPRESDTAKLDLALLLHADSRGIRGGVQYSADLFERATAARMAEHLERLLARAAADPDRRISRLELASPAERTRMAAWNRTAALYPAERCIHHLFEDQARRAPGAVALTCAGKQLTYAELDARANRLARHLRAMGVGPEARVGVCLERSPELLVAILGVLKAGGAYVPMDPSHPAERIGYVLDDSGVGVLLTQEALCARLPVRERLAVVAVDAAWDEIAGWSAAPVDGGAGAENLCYVIYTSGSTGRPKGVAMHHRGVCNYIDWGIRFYGADRGNGAPVFSSMAVDLTVTNLLPLFAGRPVHLLPEASPVEALAEVIRARPGFGLIKITPIHLGLLNSMLAPGELSGVAGTLVIGADFLSAEPTVPWQEHAPGVRLMNEYGPTETVVGCSAYLLPAGRHRAGAVPVGPPIQNLTFHVLDRHLEPVPVGLPGELYIGGAGVARGYLGRPGLTAEKFVPDPFADAPGARMYRTGDRARWVDGGDLMILGRTDHQVKVRGYRVELGEVEAVLRRLPAVRECVVVTREDRPGDRRLVAYVVAGGVAPAELRDHLRRTLPEYMVPAAFVVLDALPQTPTGKLDRALLPPPAYGGEAPDLDEPRSFVEAQLLQLWEELLGMAPIGPSQNFFELGGNSLLALRLFAQVNRRLGCDLPVSTLFTGGTVRHMAEAVERQRTASALPSPVVPMQPGGSLPPLFCVHPADRSVIAYVNLVRHLGPHQPVYGLRDVGDDLARPVARIAAEHLRAPARGAARGAVPPAGMVVRRVRGVRDGRPAAARGGDDGLPGDAGHHVDRGGAGVALDARPGLHRGSRPATWRRSAPPPVHPAPRGIGGAGGGRAAAPRGGGAARPGGRARRLRRGGTARDLRGAARPGAEPRGVRGGALLRHPHPFPRAHGEGALDRVLGPVRRRGEAHHGVVPARLARGGAAGAGRARHSGLGAARARAGAAGGRGAGGGAFARRRVPAGAGGVSDAPVPSAELARWRALLGLLWRAAPGRTAALGALVLLVGALPTGVVLATGALVRAIPGIAGEGLGGAGGAHAVRRWRRWSWGWPRWRWGEELVAQQAAVIDAAFALEVHDAAARAALDAPGVAPLEDPAFADALEAVEDAERRGVLQRPVTELAAVLTARVRGLGAFAVLLGFRWWAPLALAVAWQLTNRVYLKAVERGASARSGAGAARLRRSAYLRSLAVEPAAAKEVRVFGLAGWTVARYGEAWLEAFEALRRGRAADRGLTTAAVAAVAGSHALVLGALAAAAARGEVGLAALFVFAQAILATVDLGLIGDAQGWTAQALHLSGRVAALRARLRAPSDASPIEAPNAGVARRSTGRRCVPCGAGLRCRAAPRSRGGGAPGGRALHLPGAGAPTSLTGSRCSSRRPVAGDRGRERGGEEHAHQAALRALRARRGRVALDGGARRSMARGRVGVIFQDFVRYKLPLRENVGFGHLPLMGDRAALEGALRDAGGAALLAALPGGGTPCSPASSRAAPTCPAASGSGWRWPARWPRCAAGPAC